MTGTASGKAYERWKKTPEYQQWLKDTKQLTAAASKPEPNAFVVLGGNGVPERKFDTLAEAVQGASKGDTIEVRGNGPFVSDGVTIGNPLVIRAGEGYKPSITLSKASADKNIPLVLHIRPAGAGRPGVAPDRRSGVRGGQLSFPPHRVGGG